MNGLPAEVNLNDFIKYISISYRYDNSNPLDQYIDCHYVRRVQGVAKTKRASRCSLINTVEKTMAKQDSPKAAHGKLGILTPGMGAVATTTYAGVLATRNGTGKPVGSLTQMGRIEHDGKVVYNPGLGPFGFNPRHLDREIDEYLAEGARGARR